MTGSSHQGRFYSPTVLSHVTGTMRVFHEETFGPVASLVSVRNEAEALRVAHDTSYGLSAGVIPQNLEKSVFLAEGLEAGMVHDDVDQQ